ncbi:MAG: hypothetical protein UFJ18_10905 [Blautia sp.]|nr:hypothetical protein [Blautia sp.]
MNQGRKNAGEGLLFPKTQMKKKRMRHPKSILQNKETRTCFLCVKLHDNYSVYPILHEHHIFEGTGKRQKSEEYGLKVYLCPRHHMYSEEAVHGNSGITEYLHRIGQQAFEDRCGSRETFRKVFGKSYL